MKYLSILFLSVGVLIQSVAQSVVIDKTSQLDQLVDKIDNNGFKFETLTTGINSEFADYGSCLFRDKFISFSARKIGAIAKKDPLTTEPYTNLYCSDITDDWDLERPLLFSYILNQYDNLGTVTFTSDGNTMFFTISSKENSSHFKLYKAVMDQEREGKWVDISELSFNSDDYSVETPHLSNDGRMLYFSANMPGAVGGFDIYQVAIREDGSYGPIEPVAGNINTEGDEKYPHTSPDSRFLYFSSNGHQNIGGYDVFKSRRTKKGYPIIINMGNTINTAKDEIAFIPVNDRIGYITSNKDGGEGGFDIYRLTEYALKQQVSGRAVDFDTKLPLAETLVRLVDTDGTVVATAMTGIDGSFEFPLSSFEFYTVVGNKEGFYSGSTIFNTDNKTPQYDADVMMKVESAPIVREDDRSYISIDNIQFDFDSARIKEVSTITLNMVYQTLMENPEMNIALGAHTDKQGSASYNLRLSQRRAESAMNYLVNKGINSARLIPTGYGESKPLIDCDTCTEDEHETNRRIEFVILEEAEQ